jgi:KaiC/GvpD/RAD55 family RecA-like ATPase
MDLKQIARDTNKTLISYMTYQAFRVVVAQLDETEPKRAYWLRQFAYRVSIQDSETFLTTLFREEQRLAFRLLTVREHLANEIADYLPELLRTGVQQANLVQRTQQLERMAQVNPDLDVLDAQTRDSPVESQQVESQVDLAEPDAEHKSSADPSPGSAAEDFY